MLTRLQALLSEPVMGFLALLALAVNLGPELFPLPPAIEWVCDVASWVIVLLFALEFATNLALAKDRRAFAKDPWHILDAAIVLGALASLLPSASPLARGSPALRILQLFRAVFFGARAGRGLRRSVVQAAPRPIPLGPPEVSVLRAGDAQSHAGEWSEFLRRAASRTGEGSPARPSSTWLHASNLSAEQLQQLAAAAGIPHVMMEAALHESSYPRLESGPHWSVLTVSVPYWSELTRRDPVLLLISENDVLSLAARPLELQQPPTAFETLPWGPRCTLHVIRHVLARNEDIAGRLERATRELEELPADESPESFFEKTFQLKRMLSAAKGDLWRLHALLELLADGRRSLPGLVASEREALGELGEEADFLYETADDIHESVLSLIDLHINVATHDTNRFMRLLAAVTAIALIPTVMGGLLGMNLREAPWGVTLAQVAFITLMLMLGVLYAFMAKGWLR
jgi:magnesium transporter